MTGIIVTNMHMQMQGREPRLVILKGLLLWLLPLCCLTKVLH
jgi:hypothetical protein